MNTDTETDLHQQFRTDVLAGLSDPKQKHLSSKYFYDKAGDELFVKITQMPEYYLTRSEMDIFRTKTSELIDNIGQDKNRHFQLIELGAGDGSKTLELLKALLEQGYDFEYCPVDISENALIGLVRTLIRKLPSLRIRPQHGDYFDALAAFRENGTPKAVLFLGSTIGNLSDDLAKKLLTQAGENLQPRDKIIVGADLKKSKDVILPAYNDPAGITRDFNLNLLKRINRELGGNFDLNQFTHEPVYDTEHGVAKSYLRSAIRQQVHIEALETTFTFEEGETIHTEISRKYDDLSMGAIVSGSGFEITAKICDDAQLFADYILTLS